MTQVQLFVPKSSWYSVFKDSPCSEVSYKLHIVGDCKIQSDFESTHAKILVIIIAKNARPTKKSSSVKKLVLLTLIAAHMMGSIVSPVFNAEVETPNAVPSSFVGLPESARKVS